MDFVDKNLFMETIISYIVSNHDTIDVNMFKNKNYNLVITGTVGVGKSTILQLISNMFNYYKIDIRKYPEYITYNKVGQNLFEMKMNNEISAFTFQNYILDIWETLLKNNDYKNFKGINIFERIPYDAVMCFSKKEYENNNLNKEEYEMILNRYEIIMKKYNMFDYSNMEKIKIINENINNTIESVMKIIIDDVKNDIKFRCICLDINNKNLYYERLGIRNRTAENEYTKNILDEYINYYSDNF